MDAVTIREVHNYISRGEHSRVESILKPFADSSEKLLLLGESAFESSRTAPLPEPLVKQAYDSLVRAFYHPTAAALPSYERHRLVDLLHRVAQHADPTLAAIMRNPDALPASRRAKDVVATLYFGGACTGATLAERCLQARARLSEEFWRGRTITAHDCFIEFHKVYSSFTPLLDPGKASSLGGGYFAALSGYGCVIDPGHHFLDNFLAKRSLDDIDGIVVTHFHDDHYADLPALLSLLYQRWRSTRRQVDILVDETTATMFRPIFTWPAVTASESRPKRSYLRSFHVLQPSDRGRPLGRHARISCLPTVHPVFGENTGVGLVIDVAQVKTRLVITGDTGWQERMTKTYAALKQPGAVLVAHVSTVHPGEAVGALLGNDFGYYDKHLGVRGLCRVIEALEPSSVILSEIGEELETAITKLADFVQRVYPCRCLVGWHQLQEPLPVAPANWDSAALLNVHTHVTP